MGGVSGNGWICCRAEHARRRRRPRTILNSSRKRGALRTSSIRSRVPGRICSARQSGLARSACLDGVEGTKWQPRLVSHDVLHRRGAARRVSPAGKWHPGAQCLGMGGPFFFSVFFCFTVFFVPLGWRQVDHRLEAAPVSAPVEPCRPCLSPRSLESTCALFLISGPGFAPSLLLRVLSTARLLYALRYGYD